MIQALKNVSTFVGFVTFAFLHVYFVMILWAKPALAEESAQNTITATVSSTADAAATTTKEVKEKEFNFSINGEKGTVKIGKSGVQISHEDSEDKDSGFVKVMSNVEKLNAANQWSKVLEDVLVPIVLFLSIFGFAAFAVYSKSRTRREYLETIKALAQSGQPIPPELLNNMNSALGVNKTRIPGATNYDANTAQGIKYIFWGVGFCGCMVLLQEVGFFAAVGFMFVVMGAFHIYTSQMMQKQKTTDTDAASTTLNK